MPKIKTHRGAAKRFKLTAKGKIKRASAFHSHLLGKKTANRKRKLRKGTLVDKTDKARVQRLLPY